MGTSKYSRVDDVITRSPHIKEWFKAKYRREVRERMKRA